MARICVVDDKEIIRDSLAAALTREDHTVTTFADPVEAVRELTEGRMADLVIEVVGHQDQALNLCIDLCGQGGRLLYFGVPPAHDKEYSRAKMVQAFGDVGFALAVDELGITEYSPEKSKYGFHIIKRLE